VLESNIFSIKSMENPNLENKVMLSSTN